MLPKKRRKRVVDSETLKHARGRPYFGFNNSEFNKKD